MLIITTYKGDFMTAQLLETRPDIRLHKSNHMSQMERTIGVG